MLAFLAIQQSLNGDVQYVIGGHLVAIDEAGRGVGTDAFTHRPLVYRAFIATLTGLLGVVGLTPADGASFEAAYRLVAVAMATLAGGLVALALRPRLGVAPAYGAGVAIGAALGLSPNWNFLQAEWLGSLLAVLAVSAALLSRSAAVGGVLAGSLLVLAAAAKLTTAPYAVIAFIVIVALDRRRSLAVFVGGVAASAAFALGVLLVPHELQWMLDTATLSAESPLENVRNMRLLASAIGSEAVAAPVVLLTPAAVVVALRGLSGRARWLLLAGVVGILALAVLPLTLQRAGYLYRLTMLPIACAGLGGVAAGLVARSSARGPWLVAAAVALASGWATILLHLPASVRGEYTAVLTATAIAVALALGVAGWLVTGRRDATVRPRAAMAPWVAGTVASVAIAALALPAVMPSAAWSLDPARVDVTNATWTARAGVLREQMVDVSRAIGRDSRVLYLAYGSLAYHMGNPTPCRYPSPTFLRLGVRNPRVAATTSYRENLACFTDADADWLIIEPDWLRPDELPASAAARIEARFDCGNGIDDGGPVIACPAR